MLVLSRKKEQKILFPTLGVTLEILRISGNAVSVGIEAPRSIQVLRSELHPDRLLERSDQDQRNSGTTHAKESSSNLTHELRNQLNNIFLSISVVQKLLSKGLHAEAEERLEQAFAALSQLDCGIEIDRNENNFASVTQKISADACQAADADKQSRVLTTLLVEDDPNEQALLAGYLRMCGYRVVTAQDGLEALQILGHEPIDLMVLDMRMPRMNGVETLRAIRRDPFLKDLNVVVVSGEEPQECVVKDDSRGVIEWFTKPLDPARLVEHLEAWRN